MCMGGAGVLLLVPPSCTDIHLRHLEYLLVRHSSTEMLVAIVLPFSSRPWFVIHLVRPAVSQLLHTFHKWASGTHTYAERFVSKPAA